MLELMERIDQIGSLTAQLALAPEIADSIALATDSWDAELIETILDGAARLSREVLAPFDEVADRVGCVLADERVRLAPGHAEAWDRFREAGWLGISADRHSGGLDLPNAIAAAVNEIMERGGVAFGMLPGSNRGAIRLLAAHATEDVRETWIPRLVAGEWAATICISEPDAGSDVGRIRTRAVPDNGGWRIHGEKIWISYGDHPLAGRIGHLVLARMEGAPPGTRGLSLFLVPSRIDDGEENGVFCRRLEEKMGLHGSPTCAMGFENARGTLIGEPGRGLPALFTMITGMRLQVAAQGLGLATAMFETARGYALDRRQGGAADRPPVPIASHADVRRMLLDMASRIVTLRGVVLSAAAFADIADHASDDAERARAGRLLRFLLPIVKNGGAELAWDIGSQAVLVLGGAGYTREWPIERWLRDARVLAVFEGTTGMQGLDLAQRSILAAESGYEPFAAVVRSEADAVDDRFAFAMKAALASLDKAVSWVRDTNRTASQVAAGATSLLRLATIVAQGWAAMRLARSDVRPLAACGEAWLIGLPSAAAALLAETRFQAERVALAD